METKMSFFPIDPRRQLMIAGELNDDSVSQLMAGMQYMLTSGPVELLISSGGGVLMRSLALAVMMESMNKIHTIRTIGVGNVGSAAVLLLAAGSKGQRYIVGDTTLLLHEGVYTFDGKTTKTTSAWERFAIENRDRQNRYWDLLARHSKLSSEEWRHGYERGEDDILMPVKLALEVGLVDHHVDEMPKALEMKNMGIFGPTKP